MPQLPPLIPASPKPHTLLDGTLLLWAQLPTLTRCFEVTLTGMNVLGRTSYVICEA